MIKQVKDNKIQGSPIKDGRYFFALMDSGELRTYLSNKYLWYIYSVFVKAGIFNHTAFAHKEFGEMFLLQVDNVNNENFVDWLNIFQSKCRQSSPVVSREKLKGYIETTWVLSTSKLNKKDFSHFVDNVKAKGYELGLEFDSFDNWINNLENI